jgi:transcriptional regulator with XRE-family HTH domain
MAVERETEESGDLEARVIQTLVDLREERGWSQSELARRMAERGWDKYTQMTVSRTEKGERPIRLNEVQGLADLFEVDMSFLWLPQTVRRYDTTSRKVEDLSTKLRQVVSEYLDAQDVLAASADHARDDLAEDEFSYAAALITHTPEAVVWEARVRRYLKRMNSAAQIAGESRRPVPERVRKAEERFWSHDPEQRKLTQLLKDLDGIDPEEA